MVFRKSAKQRALRYIDRWNLQPTEAVINQFKKQQGWHCNSVSYAVMRQYRMHREIINILEAMRDGAV